LGNKSDRGSDLKKKLAAGSEKKIRNGKPLIEGTYKFNAAFMCLVPANMSHLKIGPEFVNLGILILQNLII